MANIAAKPGPSINSHLAMGITEELDHLFSL